MINKVAKFKDRFAKAMAIRNVRAVDITAQTGIPQATISQYKTGYAQPKSDKLQKIADALDVNPAWLMGLDVPMENPPIIIETGNDIVSYELQWAKSGGGEHPIELNDAEKDLIKLYRTTDDDTRRMIDRLLRYTKEPLSPLEESRTRYYGYGRAARKSSKNPDKIKIRRKKVTE